MALSIKTEEADRLARELAAVTGETLTDAVTKALRERLDRVQPSQSHRISSNGSTDSAIEYSSLSRGRQSNR